jgi:hypothetical protein
MKRMIMTMMIALAASTRALPPSTFTVGGGVFPAANSAAAAGSWRVYSAANSTLASTGTVALSPANVQPEGFETGDFSFWPWSFAGNQPWVAQSSAAYDGNFAGASGGITDDQSSAMQVELTCPADGMISFAYKVSSEEGYDYLGFFIDGCWQDSWSGSNDWSVVSYAVAAGIHTFQWTYSKDSSIRIGEDKAWVDNISMFIAGSTSIWFGDVGAAFDAGRSVGDDRIAVVTAEDAPGTSAHVGYCAVMNQLLDGNDPVEFRPVVMRPIPAPIVGADSGYTAALLTWSNAVEDAGEGGVTNIVGYDVYRSADGMNFARLNAAPVHANAYTDAVAYAAEYYYALSPVFRGNPAVRVGTLSSNSVRTLMTLDSDTDGLPDWWTIRYFGHATGRVDDLSRAIDDADGTGQNNLDKYIAGLDPTNPASAFSILAISNRPPRRELFFLSSPVRFYTLGERTNLMTGGWTDVPGIPPLPGNGNIMSITDTNQFAPRYYRLRVQLP